MKADRHDSHGELGFAFHDMSWYISVSFFWGGHDFDFIDGQKYRSIDIYLMWYRKEGGGIGAACSFLQLFLEVYFVLGNGAFGGHC